MARARIIEEERGTSRGYIHPHNGYYAGDFSSTIDPNPAPAPPSLQPRDGLSVAAPLRLHTEPRAAHQVTRLHAA